MIASVRLTLSLALILAALVFLVLDRVKPAAQDRFWLWLAVLLIVIERLTLVLPIE